MPAEPSSAKQSLPEQSLPERSLPEQSYAKHTALDPITHFTLLPLGLFALGLSFYLLLHAWPLQRLDHLWMIVASFSLLLLNFKSRIYSLRVQDRVIRLEGRLRVRKLLPASEHPLLDQLSTRQHIALRFASDEELPALVRRAVAEGLDSRQIKQSITAWRADHSRI